ncbi:uncharacterized protein LOC135366316 [Ornithodoros turicata]|uniref:uncharacterized protein LOC135366316 n=1 Tax=Ornithodoros turicata TaxID=34597 RepID=UPI003139EFE4
MTNNKNCCLVDCSNTYSRCPPGTRFFSFPTRPCYVHQRQEWIRAVRRCNSDKSSWVPTKNSRICSEHFYGGVQSKDPSSPSYAPTIFPARYRIRNANLEGRASRYERHKRRVSKLVESCGSEVYQYDEEPPSPMDAEPLVNCIAAVREVSYMADVEPVAAPDKRDVGVDTQSLPEVQPRGFHGYTTLLQCDDKESILRDLGGASFAVFMLLLKFLTPTRDARCMHLSMGDKLLLFLMKLKHGLTFSALGVLFSVHRTTASRTFYYVLDSLTSKTWGWVRWVSRDVVQETMPGTFRATYPNCRVIIDCTEVPIEQPTTVSDQVNTWSNYKHDFTMKFLVGISPSGLVSFVYSAYGGRASDTHIAGNCGILNLLEPGDMVMADKGFPHIHSSLLEKRVTLEMPPFGRMGQQFTAAQVERTYRIASHRIHVERCIQRIKMFSILRDRLTPELRFHVDKIVRMCCVLVNLQNPILNT